MSILSELVNGVVAIDPAAPAVDHDGRWYSWGELRHAIGEIGAELARLGLQEDARVGVMVKNRPGPYAAVITAVAIDACMVSINPLLPPDRLVADIRNLKVPVIIAEKMDLERPGILEAIAEAGTAVIELKPGMDGAFVRPGFDKVTGTDLRTHESDIIIEMLTSGTTGIPKRIPLQRDAYEKSFIGAMSYEKGRSADDAPQLRSGTQLLTNPMTHIGGLWHALATLLAGRKLCLVEKFTVEAWRGAVVRHRPKIAGAVPAAIRMILDADIPKEDLSSLVAIRAGAAPLDPDVADEFFERYGIPVLQNYGATEFAGAVAGWGLGEYHQFWKTKRGSVGRFQPGVKGRVIDPATGAELPNGTEGVLEMKAAQFANGGEWLRTTDRAMIDDDGFLFILGRADNAIIRGGFKVHPDDVVAIIEKHPAVREAVVVGIADRRLGAVPVAAIILKNGAATPSEAELSAFVKERALPYQVPVAFRIVDEVPRTPSMKPALPQVRALFETETQAA